MLKIYKYKQFTRVIKANVFVLQALLAHGASIEAKDNDGLTSLMSASQNGNLDVVQASYSFQITNERYFFEN